MPKLETSANFVATRAGNTRASFQRLIPARVSGKCVMDITMQGHMTTDKGSKSDNSNLLLQLRRSNCK